MSARSAAVVGALWLASLLVATVTAREHSRQGEAPRPNVEVQVLPALEPKIVSGSDIGFRIEGWQGNAPSGTLVIRVNGQWVEPMTTKRPVLITR